MNVNQGGGRLYTLPQCLVSKSDLYENGFDLFKVICICSVGLGPYASLTIPLSEAELHRVWDGSNFFGASLLSFTKLAKTFGYNLVHVEANAVNLFFVHTSEMGGMDLELVKWAETLHKYGNSNRPTSSFPNWRTEEIQSCVYGGTRV